MSPENAHFAEISILGADFCNAHKVSLWHGGHRKVDLYFGEQWKVIRESKL